MSNGKKLLRDAACEALERAGIPFEKYVRLPSKYPKNFKTDIIDIVIVDENGEYLLFIETRSNSRGCYNGFVTKDSLGRPGLRRSWRYALHGYPLYLLHDYNRIPQLVTDVKGFLRPPKKKLSFVDRILQGEV